jgi:hypothetical protein
MKSVWLGILLCAAACLPVHAAQKESFVCTRVSGGPIAPFTFVVDYDAKDVQVPEDTGLYPVDGSVEIKPETVSWGVMRGYVVLDRKTLALDWDTTAEREYLDAIGHPSDQPADDFSGHMQCKKAG